MSLSTFVKKTSKFDPCCRPTRRVWCLRWYRCFTHAKKITVDLRTVRAISLSARNRHTKNCRGRCRERAWSAKIGAFALTVRIFRWQSSDWNCCTTCDRITKQMVYLNFSMSYKQSEYWLFQGRKVYYTTVIRFIVICSIQTVIYTRFFNIPFSELYFLS